MEGRSVGEGDENVRTLPLLLHAFLVEAAPAASASPLAVSYEQTAWKKLLQVCGGHVATGETGHTPSDFAAKAEGFLRAALDGVCAPVGGADRKQFIKLAAAIHTWRPTRGEYEEEETLLLTNGRLPKKDGYLCGNKSSISVVLDDGLPLPCSGHTCAASHTSSFRPRMTATVADHVNWHLKRISLLRLRMLAAQRPRGLLPLKKEASLPDGEIVSQEETRVGQLGSLEGRAFSFASMIFFDDFSRGSLQLLSAEETLSRQRIAAAAVKREEESSSSSSTRSQSPLFSSSSSPPSSSSSSLSSSSSSPPAAAAAPAIAAGPAARDPATSCSRREENLQKQDKEGLEETGEKNKREERDAPSIVNFISHSAEEICLYPGQVAELRGTAKEDEFGVKFLVSSIRGGPPLPPPRYLSHTPAPPSAMRRAVFSNLSGEEARETISVEKMYQGDPVHIMLGSAQMLDCKKPQFRVRLLEMELLLNRVREHAPHLLILFGPIVPWSSFSREDMLNQATFDSLPDVRLLYRDFFRLLAERLAGVHTKVFVVPSCADVAHAYPLPQPPYSAQLHAKTFLRAPQHQQQITFLPNPANLRINEVELLLTSADPLMEIGADLCYPQNCYCSRQELIAACCESLLRQRTLFPAGTSAGTPVEPTLFPPLMFDAPRPSFSSNIRGNNAESSSGGGPHVIIFPSHANYSPPAKSGGAFACFVNERLFVLPYSPRTVEANDRTEWTSVYIDPPRKKERTSGDHSPVVNAACVADKLASGAQSNSTGEKPAWQRLELEKRVAVRHSVYLVR